ncbi:MAG: hypothetical protein ABI866_12295 [Dokdonella sp.]
MKIFSQTLRDVHPLRNERNRCRGLLALTLLFVVAGAYSLPTRATESASSVEQAAEGMRNAYRQQQWNRLAIAQDRDSLIAAVLLGMPDAEEHVALNGHAQVEQRLAIRFGQDPEVMFVLALACQKQGDSCGAYYDQLTTAEPDNAVNWLLLPNGGEPNRVQLRSAARAAYADTHLRMVTRVLNEALAEQPATDPADKIDAKALATKLRVNAIERIPLPTFAGAMSVCKPSAQENRDDCAGLGRLLCADRDGTILTKMIGGALLRRFLKGSNEAKEAFQMRREYVWLSEQLEASDGSWRAQLQRDLERMGEWTAVQHAVERLGKSSQPAADWVPQNPQALLLSEERTPASAK